MENMIKFNDFIEMIKKNIKKEDDKIFLTYKNYTFNNDYQLQFYFDDNKNINLYLSKYKTEVFKKINQMDFDSKFIKKLLDLFDTEIKEYQKEKLFENLQKDLKINTIKKEKLIKI